MKKLNWFYVWTAVVLAIIVGVAIQSASTYTLAEKTAFDARACQIEFNKALIANRELNKQDRELMVQWQRATFDRAQQLTFLSRTYGATSDEYLLLKAKVDSEYFEDITQIERNRIANEAERAKVPYPEPTCGK